MYRMNIGRLTKLAILHLARPNDPRCQPREKKPNNGHWQDFDSIREADAEASILRMKYERCQICMGFFVVATKVIDPNGKIFPED